MPVRKSNATDSPPMELSPFANQLYLVYLIENCHQRIKTTKKIISKAEDAVTLRKNEKKILTYL